MIDSKLDIVYRPLADLKPNPDNPRKVTKEAIRKLADSIRVNPDYFEARPILVSNRTGELVIIGGERRSEAARLLGLAEVPTILIPDLTEDRERELMIRDNTHAGEWDDAKLANWDCQSLDDWGVDSEDIGGGKMSETERLSKLEFSGMYYEPENKPNLSIGDCVNLDKYAAKMRIVEESGLPDDIKALMRWFVYRFIKIDFESVANYYAFNATDEEKSVMERLRLVLVDDGSVDGFIEDDILKINDVCVDSDDE